MSDVIRTLSEELALDPSSLVFLRLAEELRRAGQLDYATKVASRGLERHPSNAEAHDLLARIWVDRGDLERAFDAWNAVLRLIPDHAAARKGLGYVRFKQGKLEEAEGHLSAALPSDGDGAAAAALVMVRRALDERRAGTEGSAPPPSPAPAAGSSTRDATSGPAPQELFSDLVDGGEQAALLLDAAGLVTAGAYVTADDRDVAQEVGAELSGVSDEAERAMRHLDLGHWTSIVVETDAATISLSPVGRDSVLLVAAAKSVALGLARRMLDRCAARARAWLEAA